MAIKDQIVGISALIARQKAYISARWSGVISSLEPAIIGFPLLTSFVIALISAFGFQALKFLTFFDTLGEIVGKLMKQ